jgi:hypothetical protein
MELGVFILVHQHGCHQTWQQVSQNSAMHAVAAWCR